MTFVDSSQRSHFSRYPGQIYRFIFSAAIDAISQLIIWSFCVQSTGVKPVLSYRCHVTDRNRPNAGWRHPGAPGNLLPLMCAARLCNCTPCYTIACRVHKAHWHSESWLSATSERQYHIDPNDRSLSAYHLLSGSRAARLLLDWLIDWLSDAFKDSGNYCCRVVDYVNILNEVFQYYSDNDEILLHWNQSSNYGDLRLNNGVENLRRTHANRDDVFMPL